MIGEKKRLSASFDWDYQAENPAKDKDPIDKQKTGRFAPVESYRIHILWCIIHYTHLFHSSVAHTLAARRHCQKEKHCFVGLFIIMSLDIPSRSPNIFAYVSFVKILLALSVFFPLPSYPAGGTPLTAIAIKP